MRLTRNVNGKQIEMNLEEDKATRAEWAENERLAAIEAAKPLELSMEERLVLMQVEINALKKDRI